MGDRIFTQLPDSGLLPSPESLKNKFLIRARKLPDDCADDVGYVSGDDEGMEASEQVDNDVRSPWSQFRWIVFGFGFILTHDILCSPVKRK